ncbi:RNA dependent RNA polymerase-domain-containing protein [Roridomyces roridus]|uniref:RNA-dependent RNA polymerase n=1 Tax=Roridomyces roridus TaxID=1738132 RepID=A0AAD7BYK9_9AGAR|nr:RNA dependent RNA polymerase-domain-containing protein [Roridomyces roridus]
MYHQKTTLARDRVPFHRLRVDLRTADAGNALEQYYVHESRATRLVGGYKRFLTISFVKGSKDRYIQDWLERITPPGQNIEIGTEKYVFLGFTESNLKAGHVLFFREGDDFTVEELKKKFGDLTAVYNAAGYGKYAARLGLSFSSTRATQEIMPAHQALLPDLTADDGSLTSDGCGLIRSSFAQEVCAQLGIPPDTSVFQIRLGGIKGTLARCLDGRFDALCGSTGKKIAYRPSMLKYENGPRILEVQQVSKPPKSGRLNKQFILLLMTRGISIAVFVELLQMQLHEIDAITTDRDKALHCVDGEIDAEAGSFHQELYEMLLAGHDMNEPYLATLLRRFQNASRDALRKKLNIPVKGSAYLFGVVDHCGVLKEGEVYINLPAKGGPQVGQVTVMRNPAYDPNDVRVLEGVNRPELRDLTNCIVFAACGTHSEADRMGGGDLDGDLYFVLFNPVLIPQPRDVPPVLRINDSVGRQGTITVGGRVHTLSVRNRSDRRKDAIQTFIALRCNFLLGAISKEWLRIVGTTPQLADWPPCKKLVPMIEAALDVVKSGGSLAMLKHNFNRFKDTLMEEEVPGWSNPLETLANMVPISSPVETTSFCCDPQLVLRAQVGQEEWAKVVQDAESVMAQYNSSLQVAIEADKEAKLQGLDEDENRAEQVKASYKAKYFPSPKSILDDLRPNLLKASVWYHTGYRHDKQSFAWLGARYLNQIKATALGVEGRYVPISVAARSTPLAVTSSPSTPPRNPVRSHVPATPVSLPRPSRVPRTSPPVITLHDTDSESEGDTLAVPRRIAREDSEETLVESPHSHRATQRPPARTQQGHQHLFLIRSTGARGDRVCACGLLRKAPGA